MLTGTGAVSSKCFLWGRVLGSDWGQLGDSAGQLNNGTPIAGTDQRVFYAVIDNLGIFERAYLEVIDLTGTGAAIAATLTPLIEK